MSDIKIEPGETVTITVDKTDDSLVVAGRLASPVVGGEMLNDATADRHWVRMPSANSNVLVDRDDDTLVNRDDGVPTDVRETRDQMVNVVEHRDLVVPLELRQMTEDDKYYIFLGLASRTDTPYKMYDFFGDYDEVIDAGAFKTTLSQDPKVVLNVNHAGLALASTKAIPATLRLWEDEEGLQVEARIRKGIDRVEEIVTGVGDGNIDEMSFAFRVQRQKWSPDYMQRNIMEVNLHRGDVSIVTYGANPYTSTAIRSDIDEPAQRDDDASATQTDTEPVATGDGEPPTDPPDTDGDEPDQDREYQLAKQREQHRLLELAIGETDIPDPADDIN